jgi:16S rRNA (cytosine967-C5)-methyltransferase
MSEQKQRPGRGRPLRDVSGATRRRGPGPTLARLIAVRVLERVERVRAYADLSLHHALAQSNLAGADRALATELVYGTLRWRGRLDYALAGAVDGELSDLEPLIITTLRIGAYQIFFSDRIPTSAAVDEAVRCAKALGAERAAGLVNAVLRRLARDKDEVPLPKLEADPLAHLEHALSLPRWIAERWLSDYGPEQAAAFARACNEPPPLTIRANPKRLTRDALLAKLSPSFPKAEPCKLAPTGIVLGRKGDPTRDESFRAGEYTVQDEAAQLVVALLAVEPDDCVLDVCAAPGTKTTAIAEALGDGGRVIALDRNGRRLNLVGRAARRLGLAGISTLIHDATRSLQGLDLGDEATEEATRNGFDRVLADVPCSGLGSLRRNPDARWRVRATDPAALAVVQAQILARAADVTRPGGVLVYSTCTVLREENEDVIESFLSQHSEFRQVPRAELPAILGPVLDESGNLHTFPHHHDADGFFAVRLERSR